MTRRTKLASAADNVNAPDLSPATVRDAAEAARLSNEQWYDAIRAELGDDDLRAAEIPPAVEDPAGLEDIWQRAAGAPEPSPAVAVGEWIARLLMLRDELPPPSKLSRSEVCLEFGETTITIDL